MSADDGYRELLIGCGSRREKTVVLGGTTPNWQNLTALDINPDHRPDVVWDLMQMPLPFEDNSFNEIHAYEVLEHTGSQGDYRFFFAQFSEFWRILRPNGAFCASVPLASSPWALGDPSHTRIVTPANLIFLDQTEYTAQIGVTSMSDFRYIYKADFSTSMGRDEGESFVFILRAQKPSRITVP
jgi:hypothetical protein